jgi:hypothetical protein
MQFEELGKENFKITKTKTTLKLKCGANGSQRCLACFSPQGPKQR